MTELRLFNKYHFTGFIRLTSALHIGGGRLNELNTNNPLVRTPAGEPFIPGSSLKGVFRSFVDKVVNNFSNLHSCQLNEEYDKCYSVGKGKEEWKKIREKKIPENEMAAKLEKNLCDVCKVLGSPWRASRAFFTDCYIKEWAGVTQIRDGVVIDRDSETGVDKLKYDFEVIPVDAVFAYNLDLENVNNRDLGIMALGLNEMQSGQLQLGGDTSRGTGNFILEKLKGYNVDFTSMEQLKQYVRQKTIEQKMMALPMDAFIDEQINMLFLEAKNA